MLLLSTLRKGIIPLFLFSLSRKKAFFCPWQLSDIHCTGLSTAVLLFAVCETLMRSRWSTAQFAILNSAQAKQFHKCSDCKTPRFGCSHQGVEVCSDHMGRYKRAAQSHSAKRYTRDDTPRPLSANALSLMTELAELGSDVSMNYLLGKQGTIPVAQ